jgi:hypothetical protein
MARLALVAVVFVVVVAAAGPASASTHIAAGLKPDWPPIWAPYMYAVGATGDDGVNHDIVVKPSGARQLGGFPQVVDFYDYADTVVTDSSLCRVYSTHHGACIVGGGPQTAGDPYSYKSFATVNVDTGDGNDKVTISDPLNPMIASAWTDAGDDQLSISGMWQLYDAYSGGSDGLGPGNDVAKIGPGPAFAAPLPYTAVPAFEGRIVYGGTGDDAIDSLNGSVDHVHCEEGNDSWVADPTDDQKQSVYSGPPDTNGDCESRTPPAAPAP